MDKEKVALTDRSKILPSTLAMGASGDELTEIGWKLAGIKDYLERGLTIEGAQHKQWCMWQIARLLNFDLTELDADKGIAP